MSAQRRIDELWMERCLLLAVQAAVRPSPNPFVGCVVVDAAGRVLAEGAHAGAGTPHAERVALEKLQHGALGATLYVNLEPCAHEHDRRTRPCLPLVLASGIRRVVIGGLDPYPGHGGGASVLAQHGIETVVGVLPDRCAALNRVFHHWAQTRTPYVICKTAMSLDGKVATASGESKWITGDAARRDGHALRASCDAIAVGVETVLADDPALTARGIAADPLRVIFDRNLRTPTNARVLPALIFTSEAAAEERAAALRDCGGKIIRLPEDNFIPGVLAELSSHLITSLLIEGGPTLQSAFHRENSVDELVIYSAPLLLGQGGKPAFAIDDAQQLAEARDWQLGEVTELAGDVRLRLTRKVRSD